MTYSTISNYTSDGVMPLLYSIRDNIPFSFTAVLLVIWFILIASQYFIIKNKSGRGKILTALLVSSIILTILSLFLALSTLVGYIDVLFYAFASIIFFALYQLSDSW